MIWDTLYALTCFELAHNRLTPGIGTYEDIDGE